ncbi:hypothetical protein BH11ARM2_BH11ARM2_03800 [soil metagenome]
MNLNHCDVSEGPPCRHMENFLQSTADGSANRLTRWYAMAHAARCGRCGRFLARLREMRSKIAESRETMPEEAQERLAARLRNLN